MPKTFGPLHITAHRGTWITEHQDNRFVKSVTGHTKDALLPRRELGITHRPKPRSAFPSLSIKLATDFTRFPTNRSLDTARIDRSLAVDTADEVIRAVGQHIDNKLAERGRRFHSRQLPLVVLMSDSHDSNLAVMMLLAVAAKFRDDDAILLLERTSRETDLIKRQVQRLAAKYAGDRQTAAAQDQRIALALQPGGDLGVGKECRDTVATWFATEMGMDVGHCATMRGDEFKVGPIDLEVRERAMVDDIKKGVESTSGPVIVNAGMFHLPRLMEAFDGVFDVIALTTVTDEYSARKIPADRRRCSFLLANENVLRLRAGPTIEAQPFHPSSLFNRLGVNPSVPLAHPLPMGSPWER